MKFSTYHMFLQLQTQKPTMQN